MIDMARWMMENKNILRVTGRSVTELGFDIRNLEVRQYRHEKELIRTVVRYLVTFFAIKRLRISQRHGALYFREPTPLRLKAQECEFAMASNTPRSYLLRDGAVKATFEILEARSAEDWFGIYFRTGASPFLGSHLVYVRQNGAVELGVYPGPQIIERFSLPRAISGKRTLMIAFENNKVEIQIGGGRFSSSKLSHQTTGRIVFAAWRANVIVHSAEMISRDTIEWS
jgi:hypothetical protein